MGWKRGKRTSPGTFTFRDVTKEELENAVIIFSGFRGPLVPGEYVLNGDTVTLTIPEPPLGGGAVELWAYYSTRSNR